MRRRLFASFALAVSLAVLASCHREETPSADVWARVNGHEIRREEVEKYFRGLVMQQGQEPSPEEGALLKLNIIDELINNEILLERARTLGLEASDGEVEDKFTELKSPYTEEEFQKQLRDRGLTVDEQRKVLRQQISIQKLINREVVSKINITDQDIQSFYDANKAQFNVAEPQYHVSQILITPVKDRQIRNRKNDDAVNEAQAQKKAEALLKALDGGADFAQVAMDYSEDPANAPTGGDLGWMPESSLRDPKTDTPELSRAVLALRPGEITRVVRTRDGRFHILKLIAREGAGQRSLTDPQVQEAIRGKLRNGREQLLRAAYLAVAREEARVENYYARQVLEAAGRVPADQVTPPPAKP
ncbi:MAG TPA: peptidylprolyl isomerase [Patescibacteria group bacterium]|nr:peptidylprolyl isomerase [Patescibacteria group bacterium]